MSLKCIESHCLKHHSDSIPENSIINLLNIFADVQFGGQLQWLLMVLRC